MRTHEPGDFERGQSEVIGVILLVGVVVILAVVIGTVVLEIGESTTSSPPQASFSADQEVKHLVASGGDEGDFWALEITYSSGDTIDHERLSVLVNGQRAWGVYDDTANGNGHRMTGLFDTAGSSISAGESITVVLTDGPNAAEDATLSITSGTCEPGTCQVYDNASPQNYYQLNKGDVVKIVWEAPPGEDDSAVLFEQTIE